MKYKLCKNMLEEHEEGRVRSIITAKSSQGRGMSREEITDELKADPLVIEEVIAGLINKNVIEEVP